VRSASRAGQTLLQSAQPLGFAGVKPRGVQQLPGGQRSRHRHPAINADNAAISRSRDRFRDGGKSDVPPPGPIQSDSVGLHSIGYVAGPAETHPADLGYPYLPMPAAEPLNVVRFDADLPKPFVPAGLTPRRATVGAVEEVAHRLREVPQRLLLNGLRPGCQPLVFGAGRRQLSTLLVVAGRLAARLPMLLLLYGQIPHKPGVPTVFAQYCGLLRAGKQPKPGHINNLGMTTDNLSKGGRRRILPRLRPRASTS
jgi:hypothetical protein